MPGLRAALDSRPLGQWASSRSSRSMVRLHRAAPLGPSSTQADQSGQCSHGAVRNDEARMLDTPGPQGRIVAEANLPRSIVAPRCNNRRTPIDTPGPGRDPDDISTRLLPTRRACRQMPTGSNTHRMGCTSQERQVRGVNGRQVPRPNTGGHRPVARANVMATGEDHRGPTRVASLARPTGSANGCGPAQRLENDVTGEEIRLSMLDVIEAYKKRWETPVPLGPLIVPDWLPAAALAEGKDPAWIERTARDYGFDGYKTVSESW